MNKRTKTVLAWALLPVVICAVMFGTELLIQRRVLTLPEAGAGRDRPAPDRRGA